MVRNALIAGASGLVGNELVSLLIENNYYSSIYLITRSPFGFKHHKIINYIIDFDKPESFSPDVQIHDVYICLGTTIKKAKTRENFTKVDHDYVANIARWAKEHNAEKLAFVSSVGANSESNNFYLSVKGKAENSLKKISLPKLVLIRPSLLLGKRNETRFTETISKYIFSAINPLFIGKLKRYKAVEGKLVARAMLYYIIHSEKAISVIENEDILKVANLPV